MFIDMELRFLNIKTVNCDHRNVHLHAYLDWNILVTKDHTFAQTESSIVIAQQIWSIIVKKYLIEHIHIIV